MSFPPANSPHHASETAIASFRHWVSWSAFIAGACQAVLVLGVLSAVSVLVVRLCGEHLEPGWWWFALALPIICFAWFRARREGLSPSVAAAHLDRRLGLDGLERAEIEPDVVVKQKRKTVKAKAPAPVPEPEPRSGVLTALDRAKKRTRRR